MRPERVALEDHRHFPLLGRDDTAGGRHRLAGDTNAAGIGHSEPGDEAQRRGLAAAGRAEQRHQHAAFNGEVQRVHGGMRAKPFRQTGEFQFGHQRGGKVAASCSRVNKPGKPRPPLDALCSRRDVREATKLPAGGGGRNASITCGALPLEPPHALQNCFVASLAPSAIAASLAHTTSGSTAAWPTQVPKPQSLPAMTLSRPTRLA